MKGGNKNRLNIAPLLETLPQGRIDVILSLLPPLQREIATIFLEKRTGLSAYEVRKALITKCFKLFLEAAHKASPKIRFLSKEEMKNIPPFILFSETYFPGEVVVDAFTLMRAYMKYNEEVGEVSSKSEKALLKLKEDILRDLGVNMPSYRKIESDLRALVTCGLLVYFETEEGKSKGLYALNPKVTEKLYSTPHSP